MSFARSSLFLYLYFLSLSGWALLALPGDAASLMYKWPWIGLCQIVMAWPVMLAILLVFVTKDEVLPWRRGYTPGLAMLLFVLLASTLFSDFRGRAAFSLYVPLASISLGYCTLCWLWASRDPEKSLLALMRFLGIAGLLLFCRSLAMWISYDYAPTLRTSSIVNDLVGRDLLSLSLSSVRNAHPFGHANYTGGVAVLLLPLIAGLALADKSRWRYVWAVSALLGACVLLTSGGRSGIIGIAVACAGAAIICLSGRKFSRKQGLTVAAGMFLVLSAIVVAHPRFRDMLDAVLEGSLLGSDSGRIQLIATGLEIGADRPLWGQGPGTTSLVYPEFWDGTGAFSNAFQLHNAPVQIWADLGLLGLAGIIVLSVSFFVSWRQLSRNDELREQRAMVILLHGIGLSAGGYGVFALTDYQLDVYFISGALAIMTGVFAALHARVLPVEEKLTPKGRHRVSQAVGISAVICCSVLFIPQFSSWYAHLLFNRGLAAYEEDGMADFYWMMQEALHWAATDTFYANQFGWLFAVDGGKYDMVVGAEGDPSSLKAGELWESSLAVNENQEFCHTNLGWLYLPDNPSKAAFHFHKTAMLNPTKRGVYFGMALALRKLGEDEAAFRALALECLSQPFFMTLPFWEDENFKAVEPQVRLYVEEYYKRLTAETDSPTIREMHAFSRWWWGDPADPGILKKSKKYNFRWLGKALDGEPPAMDDFAGRRFYSRVAAFTCMAWADNEHSENWLKASSLLAFGAPLPEEEIDALAQYLSGADKDYGELLRQANAASGLPLRIYRNSRKSFGIMARNLDGLVPGDLYLHEQNLLLKLALEPLLGERNYLPGPLMKRFAGEIRPSASPAP